MRFAYRRYATDSSPADRTGEAWRPTLMVRVFGTSGGPGFPLQGILDTGSVECILPYEVADLIKPTWIPGEWSLSDYTGHEHPVEYGAVYLQLSLEKQSLKLFAIVAFDRERKGGALWGMAHFLQHLRVTFNGPDRHFTIRLREPVPPGFDLQPLPRKKGRKGRPSGQVPPITWEEQDP